MHLIVGISLSMTGVCLLGAFVLKLLAAYNPPASAAAEKDLSEAGSTSFTWGVFYVAIAIAAALPKLH